MSATQEILDRLPPADRAVAHAALQRRLVSGAQMQEALLAWVQAGPGMPFLQVLSRALPPDQIQALTHVYQQALQRPPSTRLDNSKVNLSEAGDLVEAAANLFHHLHALDAGGDMPIAVSPIPQHGLGRAINDRLRRAAAPRG